MEAKSPKYVILLSAKEQEEHIALYQQVSGPTHVLKTYSKLAEELLIELEKKPAKKAVKQHKDKVEHLQGLLAVFGNSGTCWVPAKVWHKFCIVRYCRLRALCVQGAYYLARCHCFFAS